LLQRHFDLFRQVQAGNLQAGQFVFPAGGHFTGDEIMKKLNKIAVLAMGAAVAALTATTASAAIVCNQEGECWHVRNQYNYQPAFGLVVHPDGWVWGANEHYVWHEHRGRGYWHNGIWITF
jgi:hypothetical protein